MGMMKRVLLFLVFLVALSVPASATISIDSINKDHLNLGDEVTVSYNITAVSEMDALFSLAIRCDAFDLNYYTMPIKVKPDQNKSIVGPPLAVNSQMMGTCTLKATLQSTDKTFTEELSSDEFDVTNNIGIKVETNGKSFFPGEKIEVNGVLEQSFNPLTTVSITLERQSFFLSVRTGAFNQTIELPKTIKSGTHRLMLWANDSNGNKGENQLIITVAQVPTSVAINPSKERANPGDSVKIHAVILDQANDSMEGKLSASLVSQDKKELFTKEVNSNEIFTYEFDKHATPGVYILKASSLGLKAEKRIVVNTIEEITTTFDGVRKVTVKNTGNVLYDKTTQIKLTTDEGKQMALAKKVKLKPGESMVIDLYQEVPAGTYSVSFTSQGKLKEFPKVMTEDERSFGKKAADGLGSVTGMVVGDSTSQGLLFQKPILALLTVVAIIVLFTVIYMGERQRRNELANSQKDAIGEEIMKHKEPKQADINDQKAVELSRDDPAHQKFVQDMLKGKDFK